MKKITINDKESGIWKRSALAFLLLIAINPMNIHSQSSYFIKDPEGFNFILQVKTDGNVINGFTREKAILDYTSKLQYKMIKAVKIGRASCRERV